MKFKDSNQVAMQHTNAMPFDKGRNSYMSRTGKAAYLMPTEINGWQDETLSWKKDVYLHTMVSGVGKLVPLRGKDAERLLSHAFVNSFGIDRFPIGSAKHVITCAPTGNIGAHGLCMRMGEESFMMGVREPFISVYASSGQFDVEPFEPKKSEGLIFQVGGPRSLEVIENLVREDLHDLRFMKFRAAKVGDLDVNILRMGMAGTLSYEIHMDTMDHVQTLYDEVLSVGEAYNMQVLGRLAYMCNHTENGYPQQGFNFMPDWTDPAVQSYMGDGEVDGGNFRLVPLRGSLADEGREAYHLNPFEAGWGPSINWNHDFVGKEALIRIKEGGVARRICTLEWDPEGIVEVLRTFFDEDPRVAHEMKMPQNLGESSSGNLQDKVVDSAGRYIGKSAGRLYTRHYKKMISMGWVDPEFSEIGTEVTILWGDPGTRQIPIKAKVERYPYLDLVPNAKYDIGTIPKFSA